MGMHGMGGNNTTAKTVSLHMVASVTTGVRVGRVCQLSVMVQEVQCQVFDSFSVLAKWARGNMKRHDTLGLT